MESPTESPTLPVGVSNGVSNGTPKRVPLESLTASPTESPTGPAGVSNVVSNGDSNGNLWTSIWYIVFTPVPTVGTAVSHLYQAMTDEESDPFLIISQNHRCLW